LPFSYSVVPRVRCFGDGRVPCVFSFDPSFPRPPSIPASVHLNVPFFRPLAIYGRIFPVRISLFDPVAVFSLTLKNRFALMVFPRAPPGIFPYEPSVTSRTLALPFPVDIVPIFPPPPPSFRYFPGNRKADLLGLAP